jgi:hypothetical protein
MASRKLRIHYASPPSKRLFSAAPLFSPTALSEMQQSSCGLPLTWCALQEPSLLFSLAPLLASIHSEPVPISPFVPAPFYAVKPPILLWSVDLLSRTFRSHLMTQSLRLLGLNSLHVPALACAQHEAVEARLLGFPFVPPRISKQQRLFYRKQRLGSFPSLLPEGQSNGIPENAEQACRVGEWVDKRSSLLKCCYGILVGRGA